MSFTSNEPHAKELSLKLELEDKIEPHAKEWASCYMSLMLEVGYCATWNIPNDYFVISTTCYPHF